MNYTKIIRSNLVLDTDFGTRQQTEQFYPLTEADWTRINRDTVGFTVGQFHPELNPRNVIPKVNFNVPNPPNFTFDNRLVDQGEAWLSSLRTNLTWIRGDHSMKAGFYFEQSRNSEGKRRRRRRARGPGSSTSAPTRSNPFDTNYSYRQRAARILPELHRDRRVLRGQGPAAYISEFYLQDTWQANRRLTFDYGVRFLWYQPWHSSQPASVFVPDRYDPAQGAAAVSSRPASTA